MTFIVDYPNSESIRIEANTYWEAANKSTLAVADKINRISKEFIVAVTLVGSKVKESFLFTESGEFKKI